MKQNFDCARATRQKGISIVSMLVVAIAVVSAAMLTIKVMPSVIEYQAVIKAVKHAQEGENEVDAQKRFASQASIDSISTITAKDLQIVRVDGAMRISFAYDKKIPLFGPVSLLIHYQGAGR